MLILAHRPWARTDPYAETGPTFLCAAPCAPRRPDALLGALPEARVKACLENDRIHCGRGRACAPSEVEGDRRELPADLRNACLHIRSATNTCRQFRVERG